MNLKDKMMNEYQDVDVIKTSQQIKDDIEVIMKQGKRELFYNKSFVTDEIVTEFIAEGFSVEPYEDIHSKETGLELIRISW